MARPRTSKSTIKNDPFDTVIPPPEVADVPTELSPAVEPRRRQRPTVQIENTDRPVQRKQTREEPQPRQKLTVHLPADVVNRVKNAAYWNPRLTIAKIAEQGIRIAIERAERENGGPYAERESELVGGRPIK